MLDSGRILYENKGGKEIKAYRISMNFREKKGAQHCKAEDLTENRTVFLKLVELEGADNADEVRNILREGKFQFHYPFIEQVYGSKELYSKHKDGGRTCYIGVSVEYVEGKDVLEARGQVSRRKVDGPATDFSGRSGLQRKELFHAVRKPVRC